MNCGDYTLPEDAKPFSEEMLPLANSLVSGERQSAYGHPEDAKPFSEEMLPLANSLVSGERQSAYGHPLDNFSLISDLWNAVIAEKLRKLNLIPNFGVDDHLDLLRPEDIGSMMILLKVAREINCHKSDNQTDTCGYAKTIEMIHEERERRAT